MSVSVCIRDSDPHTQIQVGCLLLIDPDQIVGEGHSAPAGNRELFLKQVVKLVTDS